jgi:group I intron endonuclease
MNTNSTKNERQKFGIYFIINTTNNAIYVGSTTLSFRVRWNQHISNLNNDKHHCSHLQNAWNKYGSDAFEWRIVEVIDNPDIVLSREQYWIDYRLFNFPRWQTYNACSIAGSVRGIKHSQERIDKTRAKLKLTLSNPEVRRKISERTKKRFEDPEYAAMVAANNRKIYSNPTLIAKIAEINRNKSKDPEFRLRQKQAILKKIQTPEWKENHRAAMDSESFRQKQSESFKRR